MSVPLMCAIILSNCESLEDFDDEDTRLSFISIFYSSIGAVLDSRVVLGCFKCFRESLGIFWKSVKRFL